MSRVVIIGSGLMAHEYAKVLTALEVPFEVIGRGPKNLEIFAAAYPGIPLHAGGLLAHRSLISRFDAAIVAVNITELFSVTKLLLSEGIKHILLEKPGSLFSQDIQTLAKLAADKNARVLIAYNRRFYVATALARELIEEDGGARSLHFEFTEWTHLIDPMKYAPQALEKWLLSNSSHVLDLAFHLCGRPSELHASVHGADLVWHPCGSIFTGSGVTEKDVPFTYHANWGAPGRWSVEVLTKKNRLLLKPMERLMLQKIGEIAVEEIQADYTIDTDFKPGFFEEVRALLDKATDPRACLIEEHALNFPHYEKIGGYAS